VSAIHFLNRACGQAADFFAKNPDVQPTVALIQKYPVIADRIVDHLEQAANGKVVFAEYLDRNQRATDKNLPSELEKFLEEKFPGRGYVSNGYTFKPLIRHVQNKLNGPGDQPIENDGRLGPVTARLLLELLRKEGFVTPAPCVK
jgi:hypothetical protein